ncbi:MAG: tetratricopeptide repeat protein [Polaromonas sp.]
MGQRRAAWMAAAAALLWWCAAGLIPVRADPAETDPDLAARDADFAAGKAALNRKEWVEAAKRFHIAERRHPDSADLQNYLGYSYRNLKQFDRAFMHYDRALVLDPRHRGAHEYIGEAYLLTGNLAGAEEHLVLLREICLLPCEELADLQKAIDAYRAQAKARTASP